MQQIHPSAVVSGEVELAEGASIGPLCVVEGPVRLGPGARLLSQCWVRGPVTIGEQTTIYPGVCLGGPPQHLAVDHEAPHHGVEIGDRVTIREQCVISGAWKDEHPTTIGSDCYLMNQAHVGHDAFLEPKVIVGGANMITGHCHIATGVYISGLCGIHQFVRVGRGAMFSGGTFVSQDVPPFCTVVDRNMMHGLNLVGMRRAGIPRSDITLAREAYRRTFRTALPRADQQGILDELAQKSELVKEIADFVRESERGIVPGDGRPRPFLLSWLRRSREALFDPAEAEDTL